MDSMFEHCYKFVGKGIENWDVSKVEDMQDMFEGCKNFEGKGLEKWNVNNKAKISSMFVGCNLIKKQPDWYIKLNK